MDCRRLSLEVGGIEGVWCFVLDRKRAYCILQLDSVALFINA